jgi:hypothetical protein
MQTVYKAFLLDLIDTLELMLAVELHEVQATWVCKFLGSFFELYSAKDEEVFFASAHKVE